MQKISPQSQTQRHELIITPEQALEMTEVRRLEYEQTEQKSSKISFLKPKTIFIQTYPTHDVDGIKLGPHQCMFVRGELFDLYIFLTENNSFKASTSAPELIWTVPRIPFDWLPPSTPMYSKSINITASETLKNNGTIFAVVVVVKSGFPIDTDDKSYTPSLLFNKTFPLVRFKPKRKAIVKRKLLDAAPLEAETSSANETAKDKDIGVVIGHWTPTLELSLVMDIPAHFPRNNIPANIAPHVSLPPDGSVFTPVLYHNDFWLQSTQFLEINESTTVLPLNLSYSPLSIWKWTTQVMMEEQWRTQKEMGAGSDAEADKGREMLLETSPWLLGLTMVVSVLHMVFDTLAFKNDIQFWRKKKSMVGMSSRTIGVNCFVQLVVLLYLFDNDTSWMILASSCVGLVIEVWKLAKAFHQEILEASKGQGWRATGSKLLTVFLPKAAPVAESKDEKDKHDETKRFDSEATQHLMLALFPLVLGFAAYSLLHRAHKSFYSWILGSFVSFVYTFGFVLMTPQLYINYKLKSVAHMPWKAMVYKALNTFIDDLFAFIIKMPTLHRLACLRDDLIFFIYLYQRYAYRIDYSRVNEFGQGGADSVAQTVNSENDVSGATGQAAAPASEGTSESAVGAVQDID